MDLSRQAEMLENRVRKNFRRLHGPFERAGVGAFRVYDWDIPEIRATVDWYEGHLVVAEYERTQTRVAPRWLEEMSAAAAHALEVPRGRVHLKRRRTRPATGQRYARLSRTGERLAVRENGLRFWVNLDDFIDTGLFPDHRETRARIRSEARGARFLNLFGYTGSFTCAAAAGGAARTVTVDTSASYLAWARDNLELNGLVQATHELIEEDVRDFLARGSGTFDLCVLDPPSFSTRAGSRDLDVQRDHRVLIESALALLVPGGTLYFSTNHQRFDPRLEGLRGTDITGETTPQDYRRTPHRCYRIVNAG
ncbi:MAG TPA: class I SAM-dependent methyltransferase [Myxococcales bacterium]|nr:class I SAM-dependent methyltransferase [Myxococcales bacterium]